MTGADRLRELAEAGVLGPLDVSLARALGRLGGETSADVLVAASLASRAPSHGHVAASLRAPPWLPEGVAPWPEPAAWEAEVAASPLVTQARTSSTAPLAPVPLVLDEAGRLYLARYWDLQRRLVAWLQLRLAASEPPPGGLDTLLRRHYPDAQAGDLQQLATAVAALRPLAVVTGGPGTGKTHTVLTLLAVLQELRQQSDQPLLRVRLLAPTGKAAARLTESIAGRLGSLQVPEAVRASLAIEASTIHRALRPDPRHPTRFLHGPDDPLPADLVVVDEVSMVDLGLMTRLVEAVPRGARVVLLGDRDQLASVEAGAVLGDICRAGDPLPPRAPLPLAVLGPQPPGAPGPQDAIVNLERSWRFSADRGIGALARAIQRGDADRALAVLADPNQPEVRLLELPEPGSPWPLLDPILLSAAALPEDLDQASDALVAWSRHRILCAHRRGRLGVESLNARTQGLLVQRGRAVPGHQHFPGRPVLVTRNHYDLGLFNGDMGLTLAAPDGALRVVFPGRTLHPARLPTHESAWALTVHKSQGSEFDRVAVVLPRGASGLLTRELLYTAVTRARSEVVLVGSPDVLRAGVAQRVARASGLRDALWGSGRG